MKYKHGKINWSVSAVLIVVAAVVVAIVALRRLDVTGEKGSGLDDEFVYHMQDLGKIDPNLILYKESSKPVITGFITSRAIAVGPEGRMYIAGDNSIRVFTEAERFSPSHTIELKDSPRCLTVADDGKIYVGTKNYVQVYDKQAALLQTWKRLPDNAVLTSIAVSKNDVFVADAGRRIVLRYDAAGTLLKRIGKRDKTRNIPGFVVPSPHFDVAVGSDGLLRVVNPGRHRIEAYTPDGDLEFWWGRFSADIDGFCGCCNPVNFAMLADDSFVTCEKGLIRVKLYDPDGSFLGVVAAPQQLVETGTSKVCETVAECEAGSFDVAVDRRGRVFVLDTIKNVVRIFTRTKVI